MHKASSVKPLAVALFSGGLDSILAACLIRDQGIRVHCLHFTSPFWRSKNRQRVQAAADAIGLTLEFLPTGPDYIALLKHPKHGYGRGLNPCIDCRIYMLTQARLRAEELGAEFVLTGEVLGQRPMSQHRSAMDLIERKAGLQGRLLRPLSALLLEPTSLEEQGLVDRSRLLGIRGRTRQKQMELAAHYGISHYPNPAGGCLLTDKQFAHRLKDAFQNGEDTEADIELLTVGRHFRLPSGHRLVLGRNQQENEAIRSLAREQDLVLESPDLPGPLALLRAKGRDHSPLAPNCIAMAAAICAGLGDGRREAEVRVRAGSETIQVKPMSAEQIANLAIRRNHDTK